MYIAIILTETKTKNGDLVRILSKQRYCNLFYETDVIEDIKKDVFFYNANTITIINSFIASSKPDSTDFNIVFEDDTNIQKLHEWIEDHKRIAAENEILFIDLVL